MRKIFQKAKNTLKISSRNYKILVAFFSIVVTATVGYFITQAGSFTPPGAPTMVGGSQMKTLDQIYCKLIKSAISCNPMTPNVNSPGSPAETMHTLQEIYTATPDFRSHPGTDVSNVKAGENYYKDSSTFSVGTANCVQASAPDASTILTGTTICGVAGTFGTQLTWSGSTHTKAECGEAGGTPYNTGANGTICRFFQADCPSGWTAACTGSGASQACWERYSAPNSPDVCGNWTGTASSTWSSQTQIHYAGAYYVDAKSGTCASVCPAYWCGYVAPYYWRYAVGTSYNDNLNRVEIGCY